MKVTLSVIVTLLNVEVFAAQKSHESLLTSNPEAVEDRYFQIKSRTIRELTDEEALEFINQGQGLEANLVTSIPSIPPRPPEVVPPVTSSTGFADGVIMIIDKLIAIGQKVIPTIEKGKAVVTNSSMAAVSVLPRVETTDPVVHDMGNWSLPVTKHYKIIYKNGFGSEVVTFVYSVSYQHSGTYGGKGKYLTGIRASARNINIAWGFDLDASSQLIQISNVGTANNVVAGATIEMQYTVKNWTRTITSAVSFFVAGDNRLYKLD